MSLRFTIGCFTTEWQRLERGITTGCNISLILFVMESDNHHRRKGNKGPKDIDRNKNICKRRLHRWYYHYQNNTCPYTLGTWCPWWDDKLGENADQAQVVKKPNTIKKRTVTKKFALKIQEVEKPSIVDKPVKCLVKWFDSKLKDRETWSNWKGK